MRRYTKSMRKIPHSACAFFGAKIEIPRVVGTQEPHVYLTEDILLVDAPTHTVPIERPKKQQYVTRKHLSTKDTRPWRVR